MSAERGDIAGLLLAAGMSNRMGVNKLLLRLDGEAMVRRAARRALAAGLAPLLVVLGHEGERVRAEIADLPCRPVWNPDFAQGIASSLRCGAAALDAEAAAALVLLADMPFVSAEMIAALCAEYRRGGAPLVVSEYGAVQAPPTLYDRSLFAELREASDGRCGRQVVRRHLAQAAVLRWPESALADLDLPADYERVRAGATPVAG